MQEEGMKRLTCLVRDKELEMTSIQEKYQTILKVLDQEKAAQQKLEMEKQELMLLTEQLRTNTVVKETLQPTSNHVNNNASNELISNNPNCDNENNEQLKLKITELETKLAEYSSKMVEITAASSGGGQDPSSLVCQLQLKVDDYTKKLAVAQQEIAKLRSTSESQLAEKSSEYTTEVDRLRNDMKTLAVDRNAIEARLKGREKEVSDLHKEVKSVIEKKKWVEGELERLRSHLVTVEETYTQETIYLLQKRLSYLFVYFLLSYLLFFLYYLLCLKKKIKDHTSLAKNYLKSLKIQNPPPIPAIYFSLL